MSQIYYYYNPFTDTYFKDKELFPKEWGYQLLTKDQYINCTTVKTVAKKLF